MKIALLLTACFLTSTFAIKTTGTWDIYYYSPMFNLLSLNNTIKVKIKNNKIEEASISALSSASLKSNTRIGTSVNIIKKKSKYLPNSFDSYYMLRNKLCFMTSNLRAMSSYLFCHNDTKNSNLAIKKETNGNISLLSAYMDYKKDSTK